MSGAGGRSFTLTGKRLELLQALRRERGLAPARGGRIPRRPAAASYPLSFSQQRLWFLDRLMPGSAAYNVPLAMRLTGRLDPAALAAAFAGLAERHAVLRTTFVTGDGEHGQPAQRVAPPAPDPAAALPLVDGSKLDAGARDAWAGRLGAELARRPFDLARGPLLRVVVLRLGGGAHVALVCLHHAISDGWSLDILLREIAVLYSAALAAATAAAPSKATAAVAAAPSGATAASSGAEPAGGGPAGLPELPIQYTDFACWQREWALAGGLDAQLAYWRERLAGAPTVLDLAADRPRPAVPLLHGGVAALAFPPALAGGLRELALRHGATPFMALLGVLAALLSRQAGQEELLVGTLVAGRHRPETEGLIGFFANTLVLRADASGDPPFAELLARVREATLGAFAHQDIPFERLVEELAPERSLRHMPLFQVAFVLQNIEPAAIEIPGLVLSPLPAATGIARVDLGLTATLTDAGLRIAAEYSAELFDGATVRRLLARFGQLAAAAVAAPEQRLSALSPLPASERHQLLAEWGLGAKPAGLAPPVNAEPAGSPLPVNAEPAGAAVRGAGLRPPPQLHRLFEAQVARGPRRVALVYGQERVSYGELNRRANLLARRLMALGVGPERTVGLLMERRPALVAAILAVLKAGGAYLPLAADLPDERLAFVLADAAVHLVLADADLAPRLAAGGVQVLDPDAVLGAGGLDDAALDANPDGGAGPANLCYVIYTSGSTGRPKGVMVPHGAVAATLRWRLERFRLSPADRVLQNIAFTFDPSIWQIFGALLSGGRLSLVPAGGHQDFAGLVRTIAAERITITDLAPSMLRAFLEQDGLDRCGSLRLLFAGGEALPPELAGRFAERFPAAEIYNIYGPTEAAIDASTWRCAPRAAAPTLPIGAPIAEKRLVVLDRDLEPAPIGVPGELFIGGAALARGYLGRPDLTAERFLPDPFGGGAGARRYRTGDLVRWLADGVLEFVGRVDRQVKVRGFRIELGEIEAVLGGHPRVRECVVALRQDGAGEPLLAAWFAPGWPSAEAELRLLLAERLPGYMAPAILVGMEALPRTASGKVDREALPWADDPAAAGAERGSRHRFVAPASALEHTLAAIWQELLGSDRVGIEDNFFDRGGHSLLLVRLQARIQQAIGREVPLVDLFTYPSIGSLAAHLAGALAKGSEGGAGAAAGGAAPGGPLEPIALVGMAGRFPGARDVGELWRNLRAGQESIRRFSEEELLAAGVPRALLAHPDYVPARGALDDVDLFDAAFFDIAPREAEVLDPQQRLFLETAWEALESAGCDPGRFAGRVGVFAGVSANTYLLSHLLDGAAALAAADGSQTMLGSDKDFLATRVSYKLNLRGPSLTVQTACSTSLVAVHLACRALLGGECDLALAGGVSVTVPQASGYLYREGGIASPDGHCRAFDAEARGTVSGSGAGVVVLRRLADALAAGDPIRAVLLGSAINNDGAGKVGYTAPGVEGQAEVIAAAQRLAGVAPDDVSYVEAHGTGTPLGDPIEIAALAKVFRAATARRGFCAIGSVKTNIGHLDAASGVAGLIKAALALEHREIPPSLHFTAPNPRIDFAASPFFVNAALAEWRSEDGAPRRAGVSSFGIGGTNAHVVIEEAPAAVPSGPSRPLQLLLLSARSGQALEALTDRLAGHLAAHPDLGLADVAHTLQVGRRPMLHRRMLVAAAAGGVSGAAVALAAREPSRVLTMARERSDRRRRVVFLFPGQGAQHPGMGRGLHAAEPVFRATLDACLEILAPRLPGVDLRGLLHPRPGNAAAAAARLTETAVAQPLLFAVEMALARLWMAWGIEPAAMLGHSLGEYTAACLAGVFTLEEGLELVAERGRLMQMLPAGAMLAVPLPEAEVRELLAAAGGAALALAAVNAPALCVVSGPAAAVADLAEELDGRGVAARRLHTSHAFHSAMMDAVVEPFGEALARVRWQPPRLPYLSNLTGTWIEPEGATDPGYWLRHLRQPVRFAAGLRELAGDPDSVLLEVGPGRSLAALVRRQEGEALAAISSLGKPGEEDREQEAAITALGRLWLAGVEVDWRGFSGGERRWRLPLPTYPFERQRFWLGAGAAAASPAAPAGRRQPEDWFWVPVWRQSVQARPPASALAGAPRRWLLFADRHGVIDSVASRLVAAGHGVVVVEAAASVAAGGGAGAEGGRDAGDGFVVPGEGFAVPGDGFAAPGEGFAAQGDGIAAPGSGFAASGDGFAAPGGGFVASGDGFAAPGGSLSPEAGGRWRIDPVRPEHYVRLLSELARTGALPQRVVHAFCLDAGATAADAKGLAPAADSRGAAVPAAASPAGLRASEATVARGFGSLLLLAQAMGEVDEAAAAPPEELTVVADGLWSVTGDEPVDPAKAALLGPVRVIPLEYGVRCRAVDVLLQADPEGRERLAGELLAEIAGGAEARAGAGASHVVATESRVPASGSALPAGSAVPASGSAVPASGSAVSASGTVVPARESAVPASKSAVSVGESAVTAIAPAVRDSGSGERSGGAQAEPIVALRHGRRWLQRFERVALPPPRDAASAGRLRQGGVALITGGLGGIGAALARHLFETAAAKLVLLNRTPLPPREEWSELLAAAAEAEPSRRRVERLLALERAGAEVLVVTADVADGEQLARAVGQAVSRFGAIHAVIHAAGVPGGGLIQRKSAAQAAAVLSPKVRGTMLLERLLPAATLDLYVLCSSLASILGGVGQVDYCAANAFLDATAAAAAARGAAAVSIAWDAWREAGMAAEASLAGAAGSAAAGGPAGSSASAGAGSAGLPGPRRDHRLVDQGLSNAEGLMAFERAVAGGLAQVAVSTLDLERLIAAMRSGRRDPAAAASPGVLAAAAAQAPAALSARHPRPELATPYAAPRNRTEQALAGIWEEVLGIEPVGIHDDFAELGGHSLLALQVLARLRAGLAADLPLRAVFDAPTVAALSVRLLEREAAASDQGDVEEMLARLEGLSDGEAEALLGAAGIPSGVGSAGTGETR